MYTGSGGTVSAEGALFEFEKYIEHTHTHTHVTVTMFDCTWYGCYR